MNRVANYLIFFFILFLLPKLNYGVEITKIQIERTGLKFVENKTQWDSRVIFRADIPMGSLFLEKQTLTYVLVDPHELEGCHHKGECKNENEVEDDMRMVNCHSFKVHLNGSNPNAVIEGTEKYPEYHNYFIGNDPAKWASEVKLYKGVNYKNIYPGIDLNFKSINLQLKYEFLVSTGHNPELIDLTYEGADNVSIENGKLVIKTSVNDIIEQEPFAYQLMGGDTLIVPCNFLHNNGHVSFSFPDGYNKSLDLVIDPVVVASTFVGSVGNATYGHCATYDDEGNIFTGGRSFGSGYPVTTGAFQVTFGGSVDLGISKLNPTGSTLIWASYLGGNSSDYPQSMITNTNHELIIYGQTSSSNFPVIAGCFQTLFGGNTDIFITRFNEAGNALIGSTFVGGSGSDGANAMTHFYGDGFRGEIILDSYGNPCVASMTSSGNFPVTPGVFDNTYNSAQDGVVFKLNMDLTQMIWSTYVGGSGNDAAFGLKLNSVNMVYVTGATASNNFPVTPWSINPTYIGGTVDGWVAIFSDDLTYQIAGTYYGTNSWDESFFIDMDQDNSVYIYGTTSGTITPSPGKFANPGSGQFIAKLDQTLSEVIYQTVFGNGSPSSGDSYSPTAFLVDVCKNIYVAGWGREVQGFPITPDATQPTTSDGDDFYLMTLKNDATELFYATYYGAPGWDHVDGGTSRFDKNGIIYEAVCEGSSTFPNTASTNAYCPVKSVSWDLAVFKIDFQLAGPTAVAGISNSSNTGCAPFTVNFTNSSVNSNEYIWEFGDNTPESFVVTPTHVYNTPGDYIAICLAIDSASCFVADTAYVTIHVLPNPVINLGVDTIMCGVDTLHLDAGNPGLTYLWSTNATTQSIDITANGTYWVKVDNGICPGRDTIIVEFMDKPAIGPDQELCKGLSLQISANMPGYIYHWNTGDVTETITVTTSGDYIVDVSRGTCTLSDTVKVHFLDNPQVTLGNDIEICNNQTAELDAGNPGATYVWSTGAITRKITVAASGTYIVTVTKDGCTGGDTINVTVFPVPVVDLLGDRILCLGDTLYLDAGTPGASYEWSTGELTQQIFIIDSGFYSVTVSQANCSNADTIYAGLITFNLWLGPDTLLCPGGSITLDAGNPGNHYYWNTGDTNQAVSIKTNGMYWVRVYQYQCEARDTIHIDLMQELNLPELLNLCGHEFVTIESNIDADDFMWSTGETTRSIKVTESGYYNLNASMGHCSLWDSTLIIGKSGYSTLYIPNSFTPNDDGVNDIFTGKGNDITRFHLQVFNRWGTQVHETFNIDEGWNGKFDGAHAPTGVYFYVIRYSTECSFDQVFKETGTFLLLR
jgi:gliding motility-associated-like protein